MARGSKREISPGVWDVQVSAGKDPATGRRRRLTRRVYGAARQADVALTALLHDADTGTYGGSLATVSTVVDRWWEIHHGKLSPTTQSRYRQILDQHIIPRWGPTKVQALDPSEVSLWLHNLAQAPTAKTGKPLAPASVRQIRAVFRRALKAAVQWGWVDVNPIDRTETVSVPRKRMEADSPATVLALIESAVVSHPDLAVWALVAATTGMRRSEMAGLMWRDVDLVEGVVTVHRAIVQVGQALHLKGTKTHQHRRLRLDGDTLGVLRAYRAAADGRLADDALVWSSSPDGLEPVTPDSMTQAWRRVCKANGVVGVRLHDLRHFMATQAILGGLNVAQVSARLGHAQITTTLNIYTDHVEAGDQEVADHLGSLLRLPAGMASAPAESPGT